MRERPGFFIATFEHISSSIMDSICFIFSKILNVTLLLTLSCLLAAQPVFTCPICLFKIYCGNMSDVIDTLQALFIESIYYPR